MSETLTFTSKIIIGRRPEIEKKLEAMQKKAKRMGIAPLVFWWVSCDSPVWVYEDLEGYRYSSEEPPNEKNKRSYTGVKLERCELVVKGEAPVFDGWRFVAKLTPTVDHQHNLLLTIPGYTDTQLISYVDKVGLCEHCNTNRRRKDTYVVQHTDGTMKAVGKQCLSAFVGGKSAEAVAKWGEFLFEIPSMISDDMSDFYEGGNSSILTIDTLPLLATAVRVIDNFGWVSRSHDTDKMPSADIVWGYYFDRKFDKSTVVVTDEDKEKAAKVLEWMKLCEGNEYMTNLRTLSTQECVAHSGLGLAVSAIAAYNRNAADNATEAHKDEYWGVVGSRNVTKAILKRLHIFDSYYGAKCIHSFQTLDGISLSWFASGGGEWFTDSDLGQTFDIDFRVKKHELYRGRKQTIITHVKCISTPVPEGEASVSN